MSISLHPPQNMEDLNLLSLGKWAAFCVQLIGYFPLSARKSLNKTDHNSFSYKFTWKSILPYYSLLLGGASFTWCLMYFLRYNEFRAFLVVKSATEVGAFNLMILTSTLSGIYLKFIGLKNGRKYQEFWEKTMALFQHFKPKYSRNDGEHPYPYQSFRRIANSCWFECIILNTLVIIHCSYFYGWTILNSILDDVSLSISSWTNTDTQLFMGLGFWALTSLLHIGNSIWLNFFIKIYTNCLTMLSSDLRNLSTLNGGKSQVVPTWKSLNELNNATTGKTLKPEHDLDRNHLRADIIELRAILDKIALVDHEIGNFNNFFGNSLFIQVSNCVINLLSYSFFACLSMGRGKWGSFGRTLVPMLLHGKELLDLGTAAENAAAASDEVLEVLAQDVAFDNLPDDLYLKIQILSVQLCTKPPTISARQFFRINRSLMTSVMSTLASFLVILVQFKEGDDEVAEKSRSSVTTTVPTTAFPLNMTKT